MTNTEFANKAREVAKLKTLYVNGCFGAPMSTANRARYTTNTPYNMQAERKRKIQTASADTFGFDCIGLIKGILWGFTGNMLNVYGGAKYGSNGVPDISEDALIKLCHPSTNFKNITVGSVVWMPGHIGIYIGDGLVVEATPNWADGVQLTSCANVGGKIGYRVRRWTQWGEIPYVKYTEDNEMVDKIKVSVDGNIVEVDAINKDGTNYIRLRDFDDKLGLCKVDYDAVKKLPIIVKNR